MAKQQCCPFLSFDLKFASRWIVLTARATEGGEAFVAALSDHGPEQGACPC